MASAPLAETDDAVAEEMDALVAIYGDAIAISDREVRVSVGTGGGSTAVVALRLPAQYPGVSPEVSVEGLPRSDAVRKAAMMGRLSALLCDRRGGPVLFDVVEMVRDVFGEDPAADASDSATTHIPIEAPVAVGTSAAAALAALSIRVSHGEPFTVTKSTFQGHVAQVHSLEGVAAVMGFLLSIPHVAKGENA